MVAATQGMSTRAWLNLGLIVVLVALALVVYFEPGQQPPPQMLLTRIDPEKVRQVRVERPHEPAMVLERGADGWRITEPMVLAAHDFRVRALLGVLKARSLSQYPVASLDPARVGLLPPALRLVVDGQTVSFGETEPINQRRYVQIGDVIHLIDNADYLPATGPWTGFISLQLLPHGPQLDAITLSDGAVLNRDAKGWHLAGAKAEAVSTDALNALVEAWRTVQALRVDVPESPPANETGENGEVVIHISGQPEPVRFQLLSRTAQELILLRSDLGLQYHLPPGQAHALLDLAAPASDSVP